MNKPILAVELSLEHDIVLSRQRARQVAGLLGFDPQDQTRIATAVSEIARNAFQYAGGGRVEFAVAGAPPPPRLIIRVKDEGRGIADVKSVLEGSHRVEGRVCNGIVGARRLMDTFELHSAIGEGTLVTMGKALPRRAAAPNAAVLARVSEELARQRPASPIEEMAQQNQEILRALESLRVQHAELARVNQELEETNRGVVVLLAELDEKAEFMRRTGELKTLFLSNMTHELRTPINSILALTRIVLDRLDGPLTGEQEKQIVFIQRAAEALSEVVNDLLDLSKVEAGKIIVKPTEFRAENMFGALRGMLRPLLAQNTAVQLIFEDPSDLPPLHTDEPKVSQILRNFLSNGIKYTERGEVRVSARRGTSDTVIFAVADTGIGIAPEHQETIFEDFVQIESDLQRKVHGTGLGLPLARKFATMLGGSVRVDSEIGVGSTFYAVLPRVYGGATEVSLAPPAIRPRAPSKVAGSPAPRPEKILIIDDDEVSRYILRGLLAETRCLLLEATTGVEGLRLARQEQPRVIFLDLAMRGRDGYGVLDDLKADPGTRDIPVVIHTAHAPSEDDRRRLRAAVAFVPKDSPSREAARAGVRHALAVSGLALESDHEAPHG